MDRQQSIPANPVLVNLPEAGVTANFLLIASLFSVIVVTGLVCAVAAALLVLVR